MFYELQKKKPGTPFKKKSIILTFFKVIAGDTIKFVLVLELYFFFKVYTDNTFCEGEGHVAGARLRQTQSVEFFYL